MKKLCSIKKPPGEKCAVCVHAHTKLPCNPCKYLENPDSLNSINYFDFFCLHDKHFQIDFQSLKDTYMRYQSVLHPDKFTLA